MKFIAKNENQAKVGGLGGDIGKCPRINVSPFFPGGPRAALGAGPLREASITLIDAQKTE